MVFSADTGSGENVISKVMNMWYFIHLLTVTTLLSVVAGEKCGYVPAPLAARNDTVVIRLDCNQSTPLSHGSLQLPDNATHVAVQLRNCPTVPIGLFTNVTDNLTSVTVASEDAVELLKETFEGLQHVNDLRLLGFTKLKNLSRSVFEPLRNTQVLILDGFGRSNIEISYLGSVIQKLSGTPIKRIVLNEIKDRLFFYQSMSMNDFKISNASVKELIITDVPMALRGSIRLAFPELTCFCKGSYVDEQTAETLPAILDLTLSDHLNELVLYRSQSVPVVPSKNVHNVRLTDLIKSILRMRSLYPDLVKYLVNSPVSQDCEFGFQIIAPVTLSKIMLNGLTFFKMNADKPICVDKNNNLMRLDFTDSIMPNTIPIFSGLEKLKYYSLEHSSIRHLPYTLLQYYPSLEVLKLSKNDIGKFFENIDSDFFGSCPTLSRVHLHDCNITKIPSTIFSRSVNLQHIDLSRNYLRILNIDVTNCTKLNVLNLSRSNIESISHNSTVQLTQLALRRTERDYLVVDLRSNRLHCLCNSTNYIEWLQRLPAESKIEFPGFLSYTCLHPNGTNVHVSEVTISTLEQQCNVIQTLVNGSDCPCDEEKRKRLQQVRVHLDSFFCRNDEGYLVSMKNWPLPNCFNPYLRASFIAPVVVGGVLAITVLITVGLLIYYRNSKPVRQVRDCFEMNPVRFVQAALQYVMLHNHAEEQRTEFRFDMIIFTQDDDRSSIHSLFTEALARDKRLITRDDFLPGAAEVDAMVESIQVCQWIVPVLTSNFLRDSVCVDFISRVQFSRPHALITVVWEQPLDVTDVTIAELLRTGEPLYWPGDAAAPEDKLNFWSSLLERTTPT